MKALIMNIIAIALTINNAIFTYSQEIEIQNCKWWQNTSIYQIYPRSFMDTNGDGIGDIRGIISKIDYIQQLGYETIWLSPFYRSPQKDFGYDISNYLEIDTIFGNMDDVEKLIDETHKRGMYIVFDLVLNHTSNQHEWFLESVENKNNKADWYIWKQGIGKKPPNKWKSLTGSNGWSSNQKKGQWYWSSFLPCQPDLNWRNPEVKKAMFNIVKFWLEKGVDGFRLDIFNVILEDPAFRKNPFKINPFPTDESPSFGFQELKYSMNHPDNFQLAIELRSLIDEYQSPERLLIGEVFGSHQQISKFLGDRNNGLNLIFLFDMKRFSFKSKFFKGQLKKYENYYAFPRVPVYVYSNHDDRRSMDRIKGSMEKGKLLAMFQLLARGVAVTYQGEEIGMTDTPILRKNAKDPVAHLYRLPQFIVNALPLLINRDECRTPMQWDTTSNAGFSANGAQTWLPVNSNYIHINVLKALNDTNSLVQTYKKLLYLRKNTNCIKYGRLELIENKSVPRKILAFKRLHNNKEALIIINFENKKFEFQLQDEYSQLLYNTQPGKVYLSGKILVQPFQGIVLFKER